MIPLHLAIILPYFAFTEKTEQDFKEQRNALVTWLQPGVKAAQGDGLSVTILTPTLHYWEARPEMVGWQSWALYNRAVKLLHRDGLLGHETALLKLDLDLRPLNTLSMIRSVVQAVKQGKHYGKPFASTFEVQYEGRRPVLKEGQIPEGTSMMHNLGAAFHSGRVFVDTSGGFKRVPDYAIFGGCDAIHENVFRKNSRALLGTMPYLKGSTYRDLLYYEQFADYWQIEGRVPTIGVSKAIPAQTLPNLAACYREKKHYKGTNFLQRHHEVHQIGFDPTKDLIRTEYGTWAIGSERNLTRSDKDRHERLIRYAHQHLGNPFAVAKN